MKKTTIYRKPMHGDLFEEEHTVEALSRMGNPLDQLASLVDFEMFRPALEEVLVKKECKTPAGRPQIDVVLMFKIIFLQHYYGLGLSFNEGKIIDATLVEVPRQRNTEEENKQIKEGNGDDLWKDKPHKKRHKDIDALWTKKRGENHYGYKNHVKADKKAKLIETYHTTDASVHDSNVIDPLIEESDRGQGLWLDAGYESRGGYCQGQRHEPNHMRKGAPGQSPDRRAETEQPNQIKDKMPN